MNIISVNTNSEDKIIDEQFDLNDTHPGVDSSSQLLRPEMMHIYLGWTPLVAGKSLFLAFSITSIVSAILR